MCHTFSDCSQFGRHPKNPLHEHARGMPFVWFDLSVKDIWHTAKMIRAKTTISKNRKKVPPTSGSSKIIASKSKPSIVSTIESSVDASKKLSSRSGSQTSKLTTNKVHSAHPLTTDMKPLPATKQLTRSNSFFLTRKLSKIYQTLTGSKDSLNKIPENEDHHAETRPRPVPSPFKFTRSASLASIPLRRSYRDSKLGEPTLEQLREEDGLGHGHANNSSANAECDGNIEANASAKGTSNSHDACDTDKMSKSERRNSFSLMSSLRRTFSVTPAKRKSSHNAKWSASLMNLQQIDVMISYEDLSFIDYDKFNTYEANLIRHLSHTDVNAKFSNRNSVPDERAIFINDVHPYPLSELSKSIGRVDQQSVGDQYFTNYPEVKRRQRRKKVNMFADSVRFRWSTPCESLNVKSNVSLKTADTVAPHDVDCNAPADSQTTKEDSVKRWLSCNSLRRTQSMNDVRDAKRSQLWVSICFDYDFTVFVIDSINPFWIGFYMNL